MLFIVKKYHYIYTLISTKKISLKFEFFCHSKPIAASPSPSFAYLCFDLTSGAFAELRKFETGDFRVSSFGFKKHMNEQSARNKKNKNRT